MFDQSTTLLIIIVIFALLLIFIFSKPNLCDSYREQFDFDNNFCADYNRNVDACLGAGGNSCNYCADNGCGVCYPKYSSFNNTCSNVLSNDYYYPNYFPYIYDIYISTLPYFDWIAWYNRHNFFPPFFFRDGRYYIGRQYENEYPYLYHNGVSSANTEISSRQGNFSSKEINDYNNSLSNLGPIADKIRSSLNQEGSQMSLNTIRQNFNLPKPNRRPPAPRPVPLPPAPRPVPLPPAPVPRPRPGPRPGPRPAPGPEYRPIPRR